MAEMLLALKRSVSSLGQGKVWLYILGPALVAVLFMVGVSIAFLDYLITSFIEQPPMSWLADWGAFWLAKALAALGGWMVILSASYLVAMLLTAVLILPLMLACLSVNDYPDLGKLGKDSVVASTWNSVWAAVLFIIGWLVTLPLWLIPGLGMFLPLFWMAWLNRRTFAYDALAEHATPDEWRELRRQKAMPLLALGFGMAALAHVPFAGLLAPSLAALVYIHFCLEALRRLRQGAVVSIQYGSKA
ncbi:MAG: EI24 domain-containing protein [Propionivibrio sp.]